MVCLTYAYLHDPRHSLLLVSEVRLHRFVARVFASVSVGGRLRLPDCVGREEASITRKAQQ